MNLIKKLAALALALILACSCTLAELTWPEEVNPAQAALRAYVETLNDTLTVWNQPTINSIFEYYPAFVSMGVTALDNAEVAEGVELSFSLEVDRIWTLQLRMNDPERFANMAGACIQATSPKSISTEDARKDPVAYVDRVQAAPLSPFEDEIVLTPTSALRTFYAYYPNQYHDGVNWLQLTIVFPLPGTQDPSVAVTPLPEFAPQEGEDEYGNETNAYLDGYGQYDIFVTASPEPDSAAME